MLDHPTIDVRMVSLAAGDQGPLCDISVAIGPGEHVALLGPPGGGAAALLDLLCGVAVPDAGELLIDGLPLHGAPPSCFVQQGVCWLRPGRGAMPAADTTAALQARLRGEPAAGPPPTAARALRVLLLDGVAAAWAGSEADVIARRLRQALHGLDTAVLWTEPRPETLLPFVDRALLLVGGRKQADGTPAEVARHLERAGHGLPQETS